MQAKLILVSGSLAHKHLTRNMYLYNVTEYNFQFMNLRMTFKITHMNAHVQ